MPQVVQAGTVTTTSTTDQTPAQLYLAGNQDFIIPIVFPDYKVQYFDGYEDQVLGIKIRIPAQKISDLGHAGVLIINGKSGLTKYYEYGRYPGPGPAGIVQPGRNIPDAVLKDGMITESSLKKTLRHIAKWHGKEGSTSAAILRGNVFDKALAWLHAKEAENTNSKRQEYDLGNHNCMTFVADLVEHLGLKSPFRSRVVVPSTYIEKFQLSNPDIEYFYSIDTLNISE